MKVAPGDLPAEVYLDSEPCEDPLTYGVTFGNKEAKIMVVSWAVSITQNLCIVEPLQILLNAGAPCMFDESTRCGRCCLRVRFIYNEFFSP